MPNPEAALSFLPWVRQGAAAVIDVADDRTTAQPGAVSVDVTLRINSNEPLPPTKVQLRGPADVIGIDANQIVRTDPRPGSSDFEPNCFPCIEFDRPDFPWLFTPAAANGSGQLRPWLCLVVVRKQAGVQLDSSASAPLPSLKIAGPAQAHQELPDLNDCWAWTHAQVAANYHSSETDTTVIETAVKKALQGSPELSLSRLICPRLLSPETEYLACVVPVFEAGRKAGLGLPLEESDRRTLTPAWTIPSVAPTSPITVELPVYYHWEFRTGAAGDFESLATNLKRAVPKGLGLRPLDISKPGFRFDLPAGYQGTPTVFLEGALLPLGGSMQPVLWSDPEVAPAFERALAAIVNQPAVDALSSPTADPLLAPPLYGRWHAARAEVTPGDARWLDELNLDPRWRVIAAIGTQVIQQHQETLMASAWEQAAHAPDVNQRLRQLHVSLAVAERLRDKHVAKLDTEEKILRFAAPAFGRVREFAGTASARTLTAKMLTTALPVPAVRPAMRRIGRQRGPLTRRIAAQGFTRSADMTWVAELNRGTAFPARPTPPAREFAVSFLRSVSNVVSAPWHRNFTIRAEGVPLAPLGFADLLPPSWDYPGHFRAAAAEHLRRIQPPPPVQQPNTAAMTGARETVLAQMEPRAAYRNLAHAVVATGNGALPPTIAGVIPDGLETVMMAPSFAQPMYEPLQELSQELLLPGLQRVEPETVLGLRTNRAFVDAYMAGLNFEMARELLWRGFPTNQRGTYFKNFWGYDAGLPNAADIDNLSEWKDRSLGAAAPNQSTEAFVLLLRSELLRRYPNALIYLTPALLDPGTASTPDVLPLFNGGLDPDIAFFGFSITPTAAVGGATGPGYFVVIQEHPTEPRFGVDADFNFAGASHLRVGAQPEGGTPVFTWGSHSAWIAQMTRRRPARVAIHASQLVNVS